MPLQEVAEDLIAHYEKRNETQLGKAMIVTMSRDICVRLYDKIVEFDLSGIRMTT